MASASSSSSAAGQDPFWLRNVTSRSALVPLDAIVLGASIRPIRRKGVELLKQSIRDTTWQGQTSPIVVQQLRQGSETQLLCLEGNHRLCALKELVAEQALSITQVEVHLIDRPISKLDGLVIAQELNEANDQRVVTTLADRLCTLTAILQEATLATGAAPTSAQLSAIYAGKGLRQSESNLRKYLQILEIAPAALKELLAHAVTEQQEELFTLTNLFGTITAITEPDKASKQLEVVKRMEEAYKRSKGRAVGGAEAVQKICDTVTAAFKQAAMLATVISVERLEPWIPAETVAKWQAELRAGDYDGLINNNLTETGFITRIDKLLTHARNQKKGQDMAEAKERVAEAARAASAASSATQTNSQSSETAEPVALASTTAATRGDGVSSAPSPGESSFMSNSGSGSGSNSGSPGLGSVDSSGSTSVSEELKSVDVSRPVAVDRFLARVSFLSTEWVKFPEHPAADWASFKHKAKLIFYHTTDDHDPKIVIDILSHLLHREGTAFLLSCSVHDLMKLEKAAKHFLISEPQLLVLVYKNQAVCRTRHEGVQRQTLFALLLHQSDHFYWDVQYKPEWTPSPSYSNCIEEVIPVPHNQRATDASGRILERHELHASAVELLIQRWSEPHDLICDLSMTSNEIAPQAVALSRRFLGVFDAENAESKNRCLERVRQFLPPTAVLPSREVEGFMIRSSEAETAPCFLPENFFPAANLHTEIVKSQWVKMHTNGLPGIYAARDIPDCVQVCCVYGKYLSGVAAREAQRSPKGRLYKLQGAPLVLAIEPDSIAFHLRSAGSTFVANVCIVEKSLRTVLDIDETCMVVRTTKPIAAEQELLLPPSNSLAFWGTTETDDKDESDTDHEAPSAALPSASKSSGSPSPKRRRRLVHLDDRDDLNTAASSNTME